MQGCEGLRLQSDHRIGHTTRYRKYCEKSKGEEYHGLPAKNIAKLGIDDEKPCRSGSNIVELWEGDVGTCICEEVGRDYPISRVEAMEGVCNGDKRRADNCSLNR